MRVGTVTYMFNFIVSPTFWVMLFSGGVVVLAVSGMDCEFSGGVNVNSHSCLVTSSASDVIGLYVRMITLHCIVYTGLIYTGVYSLDMTYC